MKSKTIKVLEENLGKYIGGRETGHKKQKID